MAYRGKFKPKNKNKYRGDPNGITYRSLWERNVMRWLDENDDVEWWNSEDVVVPYVCKTDNRLHRYFVDLLIKFKSKKKPILVEIKPKKETIPPKKPKRQSQRYVQESLTFIKNQSKWTAANEYCLNRGWEFYIWTEDVIQSLGIKLLLKG